MSRVTKEFNFSSQESRAGEIEDIYVFGPIFCVRLLSLLLIGPSASGAHRLLQWVSGFAAKLMSRSRNKVFYICAASESLSWLLGQSAHVESVGRAVGGNLAPRVRGRLIDCDLLSTRPLSLCSPPSRLQATLRGFLLAMVRLLSLTLRQK